MEFFKKNWKKISSWLFFITLLAVMGWLLYQNYLKPSYDINQLLPDNYQISFELKTDRFALPKLQQQKLTKNPALNKIYLQIKNSLESELNKLPASSAELVKNPLHSILFWQTPQKYGWLMQIPNSATLTKMLQADFSPWQKKIVKNQILVLASDAELLQLITAQKLTTATPAYLSLTISPWLTVKLKPEFFNDHYQNSLLQDLQTILKPLAGQEYQMSVDSDPYFITLSLVPKNLKTAQEPDLKTFLNYLLADPDLIFGLNNLEKLTSELNSQENLKKLWQKLDGYLWLNSQISLSSLAKKIQPPLLFSQNRQQWQILTAADNKNLIENIFKNYFGQFYPAEAKKILPDGSKAIELIANPGKVKFTETQNKGWKIFTYPVLTELSELGFALKDNYLMISNQITSLNLANFEPICSFSQQNLGLKPLGALLMVKPDQSWLNISENLKNFSKISAFSFTDDQIQICLGLK